MIKSTKVNISKFSFYNSHCIKYRWPISKIQYLAEFEFSQFATRECSKIKIPMKIFLFQ